MKVFFVACILFLTSCTGSYTKSKCAGRMSDLKGIEGKYDFVVDGQNQGHIFSVVRSGVGTYRLMANGENASELISCVIKGKGILELISEGAVIPFMRSKKTITSVDFDLAVLDSEGVQHQSAPIPDWGLTLTSITSDISDEVFIRAIKPGLMTFVKR